MASQIVGRAAVGNGKAVATAQRAANAPDGYDVSLNRYFSVWLASSPWNTQAAHARDLRTYFDFLWFARGRRDWCDATMDDRAAYEWWRRRDDHGPRLEDTSWDREVSTVNQFYLWAIEQDLVRANPIRQRAAAVWFLAGRGWRRHSAAGSG
ncbi:site-specific integrase [Streptomyces mirabilis]|uniref:site-specific integrase n=1 Tax=Streptomyces mirabilis TaxID=68239 RepID=UPI0036A0CDCF